MDVREASTEDRPAIEQLVRKGGFGDATAAGADALLIEVHHDPDRALSDGAQSLFPEQFRTLMDELRMIAPAVHRKIA